MKNFLVPYTKGIKKFWHGAYKLYLGIIFVFFVSVALTILHAILLFEHSPTAENEEIATKNIEKNEFIIRTVENSETGTKTTETSKTDTKTIENGKIGTTPQTGDRTNGMIKLMSGLIPILLAVVASLFTFSSISASLVGTRVSVAPVLRFIAKRKDNYTIMYAENIGKGPLFLTEINIEPRPTYLSDSAIVDRTETLAKDITWHKDTSLIEKEKLMLLTVENKEIYHETIMETIRRIHIQTTFTDILGNTYEETIIPEVHMNHGERFQHEV